MPRQKSSDADYDLVISEVFRRLFPRGPRATRADFDKALIEEVIADLVAEGKIPGIRNVPDIKYTYDARREMPENVAKTGHWAIVGRGKAKYSFVKVPKPNLIRIPEDMPGRASVASVPDETPSLVACVLGDDEQATMARVHYSGLITRATGLEVWKVQGHERTTVSAGQIEVDEVYVGSKGGKRYVLPISAKGGARDSLSYCQALNLNLYGTEKTRYQGFSVRALGISRRPSGEIVVVEFSPETDVVRIGIRGWWQFRLT